MVFFKPSMIKVGFLLVAGSQKWVLRTTHKAESLQAEEVIPGSLPKRRSDIWQPRWPGARPRRTAKPCVDSYHEPPKETGSAMGQR